MLTVSAKTVEAIRWAGKSFLLALAVDSFIGLGLLVTFPAISAVCACYWLIRENLKVSIKGKAVLVTGCDSGFGHALALRLDKLGFRVFVTCLFAKAGGEGALRLQREGSDRLHVLQLDLTSSDQINKVFEEVKRKLPDGEKFWGVVNNAAICLFGAVEWNPSEHFRRVLEVNLIGLITLTKLFLPLIRQTKGRVVNVGSAIGRCTLGYNTPYCTSKHALEGFNNCLRMEMRQFGVNVCIIEPGSHVVATKVLTKEMLDSQKKTCWSSMSEEVRATYGERDIKKAFNGILNHGEKDITPVVDAMAQSLTHRFPKARYSTFNSIYILQVFMYQYSPQWVYDALYSPPNPI